MNAATAYTCPNCHALCSPGQRCPVCGQYVPTPAEIEDIAGIGRRTLALWLARNPTGPVPIVQHKGHLYAVCPPPGRAVID